MKCPISGLDLPEDGRPCNTDIYLAAAIEQLDDKWDLYESIKSWVHGDWENALEGINLPKGKSDE